MVGTAYMVIVAFVFFIAFESYGGAKADAEEEATATLAMFHAAGPFGPAARAESHRGKMICYAREVISDGWPAMREGEASSVVDARVSAMEESAEQISVTDAKQAAAFEHWFALNEERRQGRQGRIGKAEGLVPPVIVSILIIGAVVVIASVALFADRDESAVTQAAMVAAVAIIVVSGLVLVRFSTSRTRARAAASDQPRWRGHWRRWEGSIGSVVKPSSGAPTSPVEGPSWIYPLCVLPARLGRAQQRDPDGCGPGSAR